MTSTERETPGASIGLRIVLLLVLAVGIRAGLAPFAFHPWEVQTWLNVGHDIYEKRNPYETLDVLSGRVASLPPGSDGWNLFYEYIAYPPAWALIDYPFYLLVAPEHVEFMGAEVLPPPTSFKTNAVLKAPIIAFDLAIAVVLFALAKMNGVKRPWSLVWLWLFNPLTIFISAVWGHFEPIVVFFTLTSIWAFGRDRLNLSAFLLGLAILTKMYPVLFVPIMLHAVVLKRGFSGIYRYLAVIIATVAIALMPFAVWDLNALLTTLAFHSERSGGGMTYYNVAWLVHRLDPTKGPLQWGLEFTNIYTPIMLSGLIVAYSFIWRKGVSSLGFMIRACAIVLFVFFATTKLVNEPYALWVMPFVMLLFVSNTRLLWVLIVLTGVPLLFLTINVPLPVFFRPWLFEWTQAREVVELFYVNQDKKYVALFLLGSLFAVASVIAAFQIGRREEPVEA